MLLYYYERALLMQGNSEFNLRKRTMKQKEEAALSGQCRSSGVPWRRPYRALSSYDATFNPANSRHPEFLVGDRSFTHE
jgi:hypothetical protein